MKMKREPTFSFSKPHPKKSLNINFKSNADEDLDSIDICSEIDDLLSEIENSKQNDNYQDQNNDYFIKEENHKKNFKSYNDSNFSKNTENNINTNHCLKEKNVNKQDINYNSIKNLKRNESYEKNLKYYNKEDKYKINKINGEDIKIISEFENKLIKKIDKKPIFENEKVVDKTKENNNTITERKKIDNDQNEIKFERKTKFLEYDNPKESSFISRKSFPDFSRLRQNFSNTVDISSTVISKTTHFPLSSNEKCIVNLKNMVSDIENWAESIKNENFKVTLELEKYKDHLNNYKKLYIDSKDRNTDLLKNQIKKTKLVSDIKMLKEIVDMHTDEIKVYKSLTTDLNEDKIRETERLKSEINMLIEEKERYIIQNVNSNKSLQNEIDEINKNKIIFETRNKEMKIKLEGVENENKKIKEEKENIDTILKTKEKEILAKDDKICYLEFKFNTQNNELTEKVNAYQQKVNEFDQIILINKTLRQEISDIEKIKKEKQQHEKKIESLTTKIRVLEDENIFQEQEKADINAKLEETIIYGNNKKEKLYIKKINKHNFINNLKLYISDINEKVSNVQENIESINKLKNSCINNKIYEVYENALNNEIKKYKNEMNRNETKIYELVQENKKLKKELSGANTLIEPSDSDIWNVFQ